MADKIFICGRHKNKTYEEVAANDEAFCQQVLRCSQSNKYFPKDFKEYLRSRNKATSPQNILSECCVSSFADKMTADMKAKFRFIVGDLKPETRIVHESSQLTSSTPVAFFYRFFFTKCIYNLIDENAYSSQVERFLRIFPFKIDKRLMKIEKLPVMQLFDDAFEDEIRLYVENHLETSDYKPLMDSFFANIYHFKGVHFTAKTYKELKEFVENHLNQTYSESTHQLERISSKINFLQNYPRLSTKGIRYYKWHQNLFVNLRKVYLGEKFSLKPIKYFRFTPEINLYEIFSLLEDELYKKNRVQYADRLKKYLFMFSNALTCETDHPVFFVDDILFECLKNYAIYKKSRDDVFSLEFVMWMMVMVRLREKRTDFVKTERIIPLDSENLKNLVDYVRNIPEIEKAEVYFEESNAVLQCSVILIVGDVMYGIGVSKYLRLQPHFRELLLKAAVLSRNIKKIIYYSAYLGKESYFLMPPKKEEIRNFICEFNKYQNPSRPEHFILDEFEGYFKNV